MQFLEAGKKNGAVPGRRYLTEQRRITEQELRTIDRDQLTNSGAERTMELRGERTTRLRIHMENSRWPYGMGRGACHDPVSGAASAFFDGNINEILGRRFDPWHDLPASYPHPSAHQSHRLAGGKETDMCYTRPQTTTKPGAYIECTCSTPSCSIPAENRRR